MQPTRQILTHLRAISGTRATVFALSDLRALLPDRAEGAFKSIIARMEKNGELRRVCRGIYMTADSPLHGSDVLFRTAARLRPHFFNYLSLETVLSDAGIISQIPMNRITLMSSGRSNGVSCGAFGTIEFIHTRKTPTQLVPHLSYDVRSHLWRADIALALKDLRDTHRDTGLVNLEATDEPV